MPKHFFFQYLKRCLHLAKLREREREREREKGGGEKTYTRDTLSLFIHFFLLRFFFLLDTDSVGPIKLTLILKTSEKR